MEYLIINPADNVAIALTDLHQGESIHAGDSDIILRSFIPSGHKFALTDIPENSNVIKYGYPIGHAIEPIHRGDWINEKNIRTNLSGILDYQYKPYNIPFDTLSRNITFNGYQRASNGAGIRNEIWIIPTVGCVNGTANRLAEMLRQETHMQGVDAIVSYPHNYGCSQLGNDHENTRNILRNMVLHPNAGGVLVVGLGCENHQIKDLRSLLGDFD